MNTFLRAITKAIDHNPWTLCCLILYAACIVWFAGCEPTTPGLAMAGNVDRHTYELQVIDAGRDLAVRQLELDAQLVAHNAEVRALNERIESGRADLERQAELRRSITEIFAGLVTAAATGVMTWPTAAAALVSGLGIFGTLGFGLDNRRKDRKIQSLNGKAATETVDPRAVL